MGVNYLLFSTLSVMSVYVYFFPILNPIMCCFYVFHEQMSPCDGAPEEFDQTIFAVQKDGTIGPIEGLALNLVKDQQR